MTDYPETRNRARYLREAGDWTLPLLPRRAGGSCLPEIQTLANKSLQAHLERSCNLTAVCLLGSKWNANLHVTCGFGCTIQGETNQELSKKHMLWVQNKVYQSLMDFVIGDFHRAIPQCLSCFGGWGTLYHLVKGWCFTHSYWWSLLLNVVQNLIAHHKAKLISLVSFSQPSFT